MNAQPHDDILRILSKYYARSRIDNVRRGDYVEIMIFLALGVEWRLVNLDRDWAPWDLQRNDGARIEVKQSAALQPWSTEADALKPKRPVFDIAFRQGQRTKTGEGDLPDCKDGRPADLYIFAWHSEENPDIADHRNAEQWQFFVVPEHQLPDQKTIGLNPLKNLATAVTYDQLAATVAEVITGLPSLKDPQLK